MDACEPSFASVAAGSALQAIQLDVELRTFPQGTLLTVTGLMVSQQA